MLEGSIAFTLSGATNSKFKALFQFGSLTINDQPQEQHVWKKQN